MVQSAADISGREEYLGGLSAVQRVMPADESPAGELEIWTREPVNFWVVLLQKSNSQEALIYCVSSTFFSGGMRDLDMT